MSKSRKKTSEISAKKLDQIFDDGKEDVLQYFDIENAVKRIVLDLPLWLLNALDKEATRIGNSRQALIRSWLVERIDQMQEQEKKSATG